MTALAVVLACVAGAPQPLPEAPAQRIAAKALRGDDPYNLKPWQRNAYERIAEGKCATRTVWLTCYTPHEGRQGQVDARGKRCTIETLACNKLPLGTVVLIPSEGRLRRVWDRGARSNDRIAKRKGAAFWADRWMPHRRWNNVTTITGLVVVR